MTTAVAQLWRADWKLTGTGTLMVGVLAATTVGLAIDPREIAGAPAWLKPAKFAASIAIFTLTLAWVFSYIPEWVRTRRVVSWVTTVTMLVEMAIIALQAWRGTTSHFNVSTVFDGVLFTIMGVAILVQTASTVAVAAALWRQPFADRAIGWALRLGTTLTIVGALTGGLMTRPTGAQIERARAGERMTVAGAHTVGAPDGGPGLPATGWSLEHGDLRVAHFVGLHAIQVLPLLALAVAKRGWDEPRRVRRVTALAASYASLFALLLWQALRGQSVVNPDLTTLTALVSWAGLTIAAVWVTGFRTESRRVHAVVH